MLPAREGFRIAAGGRKLAGTMDNVRIVLPKLRAPVEVVRDRAPEPGPGEVRIAVEAAGVSQADITIRQGMYPESAPLPFTLGYDAVGRVDAVGRGVTEVAVGQRVAAITVRGAYTRYLCWKASDVTPVPDDVDAAKAVCLLLNYMTAYQMLHRVAQVRAGETALVTSAAGGVGTALLELCRAHGVKAIGTASTRKLDTVRALGAEAIDYTREDFVARARAIAGGGVDAAFDAIGGDNFSRAYATLKRGGRFVGYGFTSKMASPLWGRIDTFGRFASMLLRPDGRKASFYGIMRMKRAQPGWFREDLGALFRLYREGRIDPIVADRLPLEEAQRALDRVESGDVRGKLVLVTS